MGCDGGTIPRRDELVRLKKKPEQKDKESEIAAKWKLCAITQEPLQKPIVACELGKLYKKDSVIELLLDRSKFEGASNFDHIRGLKDLKELQLSDNPDFKGTLDKKGDSVDRQAAEYICPVTGIEMSGKHKFIYLYDCGCVFSERAMKEVKTETCHKCGKSFKTEDVVQINGTEEEKERMRTRMEERRLQAKLAKKAKKKKAEATVSSASAANGDMDPGPSDAKKHKGNPDKDTTSKVRESKTKLTAGGSSAGEKPEEKGEKKVTSIQNDPKASKAFKSLFTTSDKARSQPKAHWVTYNPCFY